MPPPHLFVFRLRQDKQNFGLQNYILQHKKGWISTNRSTLTTVHNYSVYNNKTKCATCACLRCTLIILMSGPLFIFYVNTQTSTNNNWIKKKTKNEDLLSLQQFTKNSRMTKNLRIKCDQFQTGRKNLKGTTQSFEEGNKLRIFSKLKRFVSVKRKTNTLRPYAHRTFRRLDERW